MTRAKRRQRRNVPNAVILGMAHEIGNHLGALQLRLQILKQDPACRQAQGRNLEAMERILNEANDLVQRVPALALSRPTSVADGDGPQLVDIDRMVAEAIKLAGYGLRLQARGAGVELRIENAVGRLPPVRGRPDDIRRTLVTLLISARRAFPRAGTIRLVGRRAPDAVILRIEGAPGARAARPAGAPLELRLPRAAKPGRSRSAVA